MSDPYRDAPAREPFQCARCGLEEDVPPGVDPAEMVHRCERCGTFTAYGREQPRVTNQPDPQDRRFVEVRIEHAGAGFDGTFTFEREYARGLALDLLSIADPAVFQAFQTIAAAMLPHRTDDGAVTLDEHQVPDRNRPAERTDVPDSGRAGRPGPDDGVGRDVPGASAEWSAVDMGGVDSDDGPSASG